MTQSPLKVFDYHSIRYFLIFFCFSILPVSAAFAQETIIDIDGNVYETVLIGNQRWITSNLRVKTYRNGDPIPQIQDPFAWGNAKFGAWCYFNNDPSTEEQQGVLYNAYAFLDPRGLAPEGTYVTSMCDWSKLILALEGRSNDNFNDNKVGDKIKVPEFFTIPGNSNPTNSSGLTIKPSGLRGGTVGYYPGMGVFTNSMSQFWTTSQFDVYQGIPRYNTIAIYFYLYYLARDVYESSFGMSIRLIVGEEPEKFIYGKQEQAFCGNSTVGQLQFSVQKENSFGCVKFPQVECYNQYYWYKDIELTIPANFNEKMNDGDIYFAKAEHVAISGFSGIAACQEEILEVTVRILEPEAPKGEETQILCAGASIEDLVAVGDEIRWYPSLTSTSPLSPGTLLQNSRLYYAENRLGSCINPNRLKVQVQLVSPTRPTAAANQEVCQGTRLSGLTVQGENLVWYTEAGEEVSAETLAADNVTYLVASKVSDCESDRVQVRVVLTGPSLPTAAENQEFCSGARVSELNATGQNIRWYSSESGGSLLDGNTVLADGQRYYATQTVDGCESRSRREVRVTLLTVPEVIAPQLQEFCNTATVADLQATGNNIRWYVDQNLTQELSPTSQLENGRIYFATQTLNGCEGPSLTVQVAINAVAVPRGDGEQGFCTGATIADLVASGSDIRWFASATGGAALANTALIQNGITYFAEQQSGNCRSASRLAVRVTISSTDLPTAAANQTFCTGATVNDIAITGQNIRFYASSSGNDLLSNTEPLVDGRTYFASQTIGGCESSARRSVQVRVPNVSPVTASQSQSFCNAATVTNLQATGSNIRWYTDQNLIQELTLNSPLENDRTYHATQTIEGCEGPSLAVQVAINVVATPQGDSEQGFCTGATIADLVASGSEIRWFASATGGAALANSTVLQNGITYFAEQQSANCQSASRLAVRVTISSTDLPTATANQTLCTGATVNDIAITGQNIRWYSSSTGSDLLPNTEPLVDGRTYFASQTIGGCESSARRSVQVRVPNVSPVTAPQSQSFCNAATVSNLQATGTNIRWYADQNLTQQLSPNSLLENGRTYYATQTQEGCESTAVAVQVSITNVAAPTGNAEQEFCSGAFVSDLTVTGTAVQWFSTATGGSPLANNLPLQDGVTYYAEQTINSCQSATRLAVRVRINIPQLPGGASQQEFCEGASVSELQATGTNLVWYRNATGTETLNPNDPIQDGGVYYVSQRIGNCESARKEVWASIIRVQPAIAEGEQQFCESDAPTVAKLFAVGESIRWYSNASGGNPLGETERLVDGQTYYAVNVARGCESSTRTAVRVSVQPCEVEVFNMVTRDGNNKNEYLKIKNIESFPDNRLEIFNRYGVLVWAVDGYGQDGKFFYGESNQLGISQAGLGLPSGNYLYALTYKKPGASLPKRETGYLYLINTQR